MENREYLYRVHYNNGQKTDVAVSFEDYQEIIECLIDQPLSMTMMMNFKNCSKTNHVEMTSVPFVTLPLSYLLTKSLFYFTNRMGAGHKIFGPMWFTTHFAVCWYAYTKPYPKRIYTKILADAGTDGQYIRTQLSQSKPGLWRVLSRELHNKGFLFPEMLENQTNTEFTTNFIEPLQQRQQLV